MNAWGVVMAAIEMFGPLIAQVVEKAMKGDPNPTSGLLTEKAERLIASPMKSRLALEAAKARAAAQGG